MGYSWESMLDEFRKLGGTADNFVQREGTRGRGVFPADVTRPIRLRVPENLLVPIEEIEFVDDELRIRKSAAVESAERTFIEKYECEFSWGRGGRSETAAFLEGMQKLCLAIPLQSQSRQIVEQMANRMGNSVGQRFLNTRAINYRGKDVLMPVMELVNHDFRAAQYDCSNGVSIEGSFADEVLVRYNLHDPLSIFIVHGFASRQPMAFSLAFEYEGLVIGRDINLNAKLGSFNVPEFTIEDGKIRLSALMLGNSIAPRLPKSIFLNVAERAGRENASEEFEAFCHRNRMIHLGLLEVVETLEGDFALTVRKMLRLQLEAMSHCYGTRSL